MRNATFRRFFRNFDYTYLLPLSAFFSEKLALPVNLLRLGILYFLKADWREEIGDADNFSRRALAIADMQKSGATLTFDRLLYSWILDEWRSYRLINGNLLNNIKLSAELPHEPTLWITSHFGASIPAAPLVALNGRKTNFMATKMIEADYLPEGIRDFYDKKKRLSFHA